MSDDLISRNRAIESLRKIPKVWTGNECLVNFQSVVDYINSQPTAYDVNKVIQKITELQLKIQEKFYGVEYEEYAVMLRGQLRSIADCLEIVKSGGVAND